MIVLCTTLQNDSIFLFCHIHLVSKPRKSIFFLIVVTEISKLEIKSFSSKKKDFKFYCSVIYSLK